MTQNSRSSNVPGDLLILLTMGIFGAYPLFLRWFPDISPLTFLLAFQAAGAIGFFMLWIGNRQKVSPYARKLIVALVLVSLGSDFGYLVAIRLTSIANAAFSHQLTSVFMLLLAPWLLREQTQRNEWIAFIFSVVGLGILYTGSFSGSGRNDILGITLGVLSALCLALLFVIYRLLAREKLHVATINFWRHFVSTIVLVPIIFSVEKVSYTPNQIYVLTVFGLLFALIASGINNFALMRSRALHASIIAKSEPVFAGVYAFLIFGEQPTLQLLLGGTLIVGSGIWLAMQKKDS